MLKGPLAQKSGRTEPFEVRMAQRPEAESDVFGPTMSKHATLEAAREWRKRYYRSCIAQRLTPPPLVIVEIRYNCIIRYIGKRALAIYREGRRLRVEDLRTEICLSPDSLLDTKKC